MGKKTNSFNPTEVKERIIRYLNDLDYFLFNENDLQIYLAMRFKEDCKDYKVYTEYHLPKGFNSKFDDEYKLWQTETPSIDIVLESKGKFIAIELKYKLKKVKMEGLCRFGKESDNKDIDIVTNQSAQNNARYDFWKDVKRLELIKDTYNICGGIAILLTNDKSYTETKKGCNYEAFGLTEEKGGKLCWKKAGKDVGGKGIRKKNNGDPILDENGKQCYVRPNFKLSNSYKNLKWEKDIKIKLKKDIEKAENLTFYCYSVIVRLSLSEQFALLSYHIAKIDNRVTIDELEYTVLYIAEAIKDFKVSEKLMAKHIGIDEYDVNDVIHSVGEDHRGNMLRALVMVATANNHLTKKKEEYLNTLAKAWNIDEKKCGEYLKKLKEQGVTKYLYENEDYLNDIREGRIICEGINVEEIKNMLLD